MGYFQNVLSKDRIHIKDLKIILEKYLHNLLVIDLDDRSIWNKVVLHVSEKKGLELEKVVYKRKFSIYSSICLQEFNLRMV